MICGKPFKVKVPGINRVDAHSDVIALGVTNKLSSSQKRKKFQF